MRPDTRGRERAVPLHPRLRDALARWRVECPDARYVFPSPRLAGQPVGDTWVRVTVRQVGEAAGVPDLHPHALRHTHATRLVETGADLLTVQTALGHADPKTTSMYVKLRPERVAEAVDRLDF